MNNSACFVTRPTKEQFSELMNWLKFENEKFNDGFYCNRRSIEESFIVDLIFCILVDSNIVGFLCWTPHDKSINIDYLQIMREDRGFGYGQFLVNKSIDYFIEKGFEYVKLECSPAKSKLFWRKMGFKPYSLDIGECNQHMYRIIGEALESGFKIGTHYFELWNGEPHETREKKPDSIWTLTFKDETNELMHPIIHPCRCDWRIRYRIGNEILKDSKANRFGLDIQLPLDFIYISHLPRRDVE